MANKKEKIDGKRVVKSDKRTKAPLVIVICAVVLVAALYTGLCAWAGSHVLPNRSAAGVQLGGLSAEDATDRLEQAAQEWQGKSVPLTFNGQSIPCELDKAEPAFDTGSVLKQLSAGEEPFLKRGLMWLQAVISREHHEAENSLVFQDQLYIDGLLTELTTTLTQRLIQDAYAMDEDSILFQRGVAGMAVDLLTVEEELLERLEKKDYSDLVLEAQITQPEVTDFEDLYAKIYVEPVDSFMEPETFQITPHVTGVSFDVSAAQAMYENAAPGEQFRIPLIFTEPEITTEIMEASLFADKLGEAKSWVSGSSGRKSNVKLAASFCDGTILLPGEEFSYWSKIAPCTVEQGFKPAPTYLDGKTVDGIGGGVCQMSSSIYTAALYSNLEIVQRNQHTYAVGYLPDGCDAMVSSGTSDFKFKNNTEWPIKITAGVKNGQLTVQIWGTKVDDTYVKLEFKELSRTPHSTVYKIDNSIAVGTTKEEANGYTGRKNETYRCVYAGDGTLISRTLENKNNYRMRDEIILINSADAYKYGVDPVTGEKLPEGVAPTLDPTPVVTPEPTPSDSGTMPDWLGGGTTTQDPVVSPEPIPTPATEIPDWLRPVGPTENDV